MTDSVLITCEHGGNQIPSAYRYLFDGHEALLPTHRGYDAGALTMARNLARELNAPLVASTVSRLLIDLNRSVGHPDLYSGATRDADAEVRRQIVARYYLPYRGKVEHEVAQAIANGKRLIHISSHSFTPELDGDVRNADIGLLYNPDRSGEVGLCHRWRACLKQNAPELKVRRNYPYIGKADGLTSFLRRLFPAGKYIGIELEINQKHVNTGRRWPALQARLIDSLRSALTATR